MINGLEGIGSGKGSYEAVTFHVLQTLRAGRKVIITPLKRQIYKIDPAFLISSKCDTSLLTRWAWDAARVDDQGNGEAFQLVTGLPSKRH
jgi:hypothetical protein